MAEQRSRSWNARQTLAAIAVAAVIGGIGGAAIYGASQGQPHAPVPLPGIGGPLHGPPPGAGRQPQPAEPSGALHSEYVVADGRGGYSTKLTQTGVVDEITPSVVVVRSVDGYAQIYTFPSVAAASTRSIEVNDTVTVDATRTGATVTLNRIGAAPPPAN